MPPPSALSRRLSWIAVGTLAGLLLCHRWMGPDIWTHLFLARQILLTHAPQAPDHLILRQAGYINVYWLFQLVVLAAYTATGVPGVTILFIVFWAAAFAIWLRTAGLVRAGSRGAAVWLAAVLICQTRFEERPEVVSYILLALQVHWLATWDSDDAPMAWKCGRFALVESLWANVHGTFVFGPILVLLRLASTAAANPFLQEDREDREERHWGVIRILDRTFAHWLASRPSRSPCKNNNGTTARPEPSRPSCKNFRSLCFLLGLTLLASFLSPFGWHGWAGVIASGRVLGHLNHSIEELLPTWNVPRQVWTVDVFWGAWAAVLAAGAWLALKEGLRRHAFALLLAAIGLCAGAMAYRNLPLFVFLSAPLLSALPLPQLAGASPASLRFKFKFAFSFGTIIAAALSLCVITGGFYRSMGMPTRFGFGLSDCTYPVGAADYLRSQAFSGSVFNRMADGGYLEFHLPNLRLYSDPRITDAGPVAEYFRALRDPRHFQALQTRSGFDAAELSVAESPNVAAALYRDHRWAAAYADPHRVVFVDRTTPAGAAAGIVAPRYYDGQDLTLPSNETASVAWIAIFAASDERGQMLEALRQFAAAPKVPSTLVEIAQRYAMVRADAEAADLARSLQPKEFPSHNLSPAAIDQLLGL